MTKPASELIALADIARDWAITCPQDRVGLRDAYLRVETALRTAADEQRECRERTVPICGSDPDGIRDTVQTYCTTCDRLLSERLAWQVEEALATARNAKGL